MLIRKAADKHHGPALFDLGSAYCEGRRQADSVRLSAHQPRVAGFFPLVGRAGIRTGIRQRGIRNGTSLPREGMDCHPFRNVLQPQEALQRLPLGWQQASRRSFARSSPRGATARWRSSLSQKDYLMGHSPYFGATFLGARRVDGSRAVFLLVACCTQEEDAAGASPQAQEIARDSSKKPDGIGTVSGLRAPPAPALPVGNLSEVDR